MRSRRRAVEHTNPIALATELDEPCRRAITAVIAAETATPTALDAVRKVDGVAWATGCRRRTSRPSGACSAASCSTTTSCTTSSPFLRVEDFYRDAHQVIYAAIRDLYDKGKGIDAVTLADELKPRDQFEQVGGDETLDRDRRQRPARGQRQVLRRDRQGEGDQPPVDRERHRDHPRRLFQSIHRPGAARIGRAQDLRHRRGSDPGVRRSSSRTSSSRRWTGSPIRADSGGHAVTGVGVGTDRPRRHHRRVPARATDHRGGTAEHGQDGAGAQYLRSRRDQSQDPGAVRQPGDGPSRDRRAPPVRRSRVDGHKLRTGKGLGIAR